MLHELVPAATTIGFLLNPNLPQSPSQIADVQEAAHTLNLQVHILSASTDQEIESAFESVAPQHIQALAVAADPFFDTRRQKLVALAARYALPTMYHFREFAAAGGLVSYGISASDAYRQVGVYTGRVLKGAKPADRPVVQSKIRAGDQSQDCKRARSQHFRQSSVARRRGDRVVLKLTFAASAQERL
jgi:putative ABC transport system substrate-binding protein